MPRRLEGGSSPHLALPALTTLDVGLLWFIIWVDAWDGGWDGIPMVDGTEVPGVG
jgi:hypothetical protein